MTLALVPAAGSALLALALAAVVLMRGWHRLANVSFAVAMAGLAGAHIGYTLLLRATGEQAAATIAGLAEVATLPAWTVFAITFAAPDAAVQLRRWGWAVGLSAAMTVGLLAASTVQPFARMEPGGSRIVLLLTPLGRWSAILALLVSVFVLFQLESTLRNSSGTARQRIKYFVLSLFGILGGNVFGQSQQILYGEMLVGRLPMQSATTLLSLGLMALAMVRHRLLDVNVFISRQAVYSSVAVGVVGVYLLALGLAGEVLMYFGLAPDLFVAGLAVFVSSMALVGGFLSESVRWRVKRAISTHFYRSKYDYRREWSEFTAHVSSIESPELIPGRILEKVSQTLGASGGALWLRDPDRQWRLAAWVGSRAEFQGMDPESLIASSASGGLPVFSARRVPRTRVVPLETEGQVVGLVAIVAARGGGLTFEDDELLGTFASQAATVILNARLSEQLARARELEAVHRLSTFVLHDLKNCVAMLSLVSQNAQKHGDKPGFQRDAFRTVGESVRQMQELMGKLTSTARQPVVAARPSRINKLVEEIVARARMGPKGTVDIRTDLDSSADTVAVADETVQTIVSNLLLNAVEAIGDTGRVEVTTSREGPWVTLAVADTGCGMSVEFVRDQLFVPLRTTKARGLGVGLYQVKSLVDALGGRIRVESRQGRGTTFWIDLPAEGNRR